MRRFKKNTGKNLYQLNKVRFEAQAWKHAAKDLEQEVINAYREKDRAERQKKALLPLPALRHLFSAYFSWLISKLK